MESSTATARPELVGGTEIANKLVVSPQRVNGWAASEGFPAPRAVLASGRIWEWPAVEAWARERGHIIDEEGGG